MSFLNIRIYDMFLQTAYTHLLRLLSVIRILGIEPILVFGSLLEHILNDFKNNLGRFLVF
jgi:hypothetical protein